MMPKLELTHASELWPHSLWEARGGKELVTTNKLERFCKKIYEKILKSGFKHIEEIKRCPSWETLIDVNVLGYNSLYEDEVGLADIVEGSDQASALFWATHHIRIHVYLELCSTSMRERCCRRCLCGVLLA